MGILSKIVNFFKKAAPVESGDEEKPMYRNFEDGPTLIYSDEPNLSDAVYDKDSGRMVGHASSSAAADRNRIAQINATYLVPGQVVQRPRQRRPVQQQVQQPVQQASQPAQPQQAVPAPEPEPPQQVVIQPQVQPQQPVYQQQVYQQPMYQQPVYPQQPYYQQPVYQQPYGYQSVPQQVPQQPVQPADGGVKLVEGEQVALAPNFPNYEMIQVNDTYHLYVDLPGVKKEDLRMNFSGGSLYVSGHRELMCEKYRPKAGKGKSKGNKGKKPVYEALIGVGRHLLGDFNFPFYFPNPVDTSPKSFKAAITDGILHIEMKIAGADTGISIGLGG